MMKFFWNRTFKFGNVIYVVSLFLSLSFYLSLATSWRNKFYKILWRIHVFIKTCDFKKQKTFFESLSQKIENLRKRNVSKIYIARTTSSWRYKGSVFYNYVAFKFASRFWLSNQTKAILKITRYYKRSSS